MGEHIYWVLPKMGAYMGSLHPKRFKVYKRVGISRSVRKSVLSVFKRRPYRAEGVYGCEVEK